MREPCWRCGTLWLLLPLLLLALSGCAAPPPLEMRMGIVGGSQTLWRYMAQKNDELLAPSGYQVAFTVYGSEADLKEAFLQDEVQVMATLPTQLPALAQAGLQVQYFLPIAWLKEGYPIIVPSGSPVQSIADLAGKKLSAFPPDHPGLAYWRGFVAENYGFRLEEKVTLTHSQNPEGPLLNAEADAAMVDSVAWSGLKGQGRYRVLSDLGSEWGKRSSRMLMYGGYVARKEWVDRNGKFLEDFIKRNYEALQLYQKDRTAFLEVATAYAGEGTPPLSREANQFVADYLGLGSVPPERVYISQADVEDYQEVFRMLAKAGYLKSEPPSSASIFYLSPNRPKG